MKFLENDPLHTHILRSHSRYNYLPVPPEGSTNESMLNCANYPALFLVNTATRCKCDHASVWVNEYMRCDTMRAPDTALFYAELTPVRKIRIQGRVVLNPSRAPWNPRWFYGEGARKRFDPCNEKSRDFRDLSFFFLLSSSCSRVYRVGTVKESRIKNKIKKKEKVDD